MSRWKIAAGIALAGAAAAGYVAARSGAQRVTRAVERAASAAGVSVQRADFSWLGPLRLEGGTLHPGAQTAVRGDAIDVEWRRAGGSEARAHVSGLACRGVRVQRGPLAVDLPAAAFA